MGENVSVEREVSNKYGTGRQSGTCSWMCCECMPNGSYNQARKSVRGKACPCRDADHACTSCAIFLCINCDDRPLRPPKTMGEVPLVLLLIMHGFTTTPDNGEISTMIVPPMEAPTRLMTPPNSLMGIL